MITASVIFLFSGLMLYNNSFSQSQSDRLDELDRRAYEGQLKTYDRCVWSYNRLVSELNVKGPSSLFEVCGEPPLPPKSVSDQGDPVVGFNFSDFGSPTRLELNRDAAVVINALGLTPSINGNAGTAWFAEKQPVADVILPSVPLRIAMLPIVGWRNLIDFIIFSAIGRF